MKKLMFLMLLIPCALLAQEQSTTPTVKPFQHMEVGFTAGTTGFGADLAFPLNKHLKLRAGFAAMPKLSNSANYSMKSVNGREVAGYTGKVERLAEILGDMMNNKNIDEQIKMDRHINYWNAKLLLDWYPFHKKNWHFTAGFYVGSRRIANIHNALDEAPSTIAIVMYNDMYDQIQGLGPYEYPTMHIGNVSFELDPIAGQTVKDRYNKYGRIAVQFGEDENGTPFYTEPNRDGVIKAEGLVNAFKPYVGFGYNAQIGKDKRWDIGFDAGVMVWGTPHIYSSGYKYHAEVENYPDRFEYIDRLCLIHDVRNIGGNVGSTVKFIRHLPILPVIEFKLAYRVF